MNYFTLSELVRSDTADRLGLENTPSEEHCAHLEELVACLLDPLREAWMLHCAENNLGNPAIRVGSGYRCVALNRAVGGAAHSAHTAGWAADLVPVNGRMKAFGLFCREWVANVAFDQLISENESDRGIPRWIHIGLKSLKGEQRREKLRMKRGRYFPME